MSVVAFVSRSHKIRELYKTVASIEIVGVDDGKIVIDRTLSTQHCVSCAPRLDSAFRDLYAVRQIVDVLKNVIDLNVIFDALAYGFAEYIEIFFLNDEHNVVKSRLECIINRVIENEFAVGADGVDLL